MPRIPNSTPVKRGRPPKNNSPIDPPVPPSNNGAKLITVKQCKICSSPYRDEVDLLLARAFSYRKIEEYLKDLGQNISYKSVERHANSHLSLELGQFAKLAEQRTEEIQKAIAEQSFRNISNMAALDLIIYKFWDGLLYGRIALEAKDGLQAIKLREELEKSGMSAIEEEFGKQLNAIIIAIQEIVPEEMWPKIVTRAKDISKGNMFKQIEAPILEGPELIAEIEYAEKRFKEEHPELLEEDDDIIDDIENKESDNGQQRLEY